MASHSGKKPKPVHERVWEKVFIRANSMCINHDAIRFTEAKCKWYFHLTYTPAVHPKDCVRDTACGHLPGKESCNYGKGSSQKVLYTTQEKPT